MQAPNIFLAKDFIFCHNNVMKLYQSGPALLHYISAGTAQ